LEEGIANNGPCFLPTCKMSKNRLPLDPIYNMGTDFYRMPSWCDRILQTPGLKCTVYDRFEHSAMTSDHCGVYAILECQSQESQNTKHCGDSHTQAEH